MPYQYATERADYRDLSSGRVLYSLPGHPAFPVRLASEMFQRCLAQRPGTHRDATCVVHDPCCGTGYLLSVIAFLHPAQIGCATGSDIDGQAAALAGRNLGLLSQAGLDQRIAELETLLKQYGKASHQEALESALRLRKQVQARPHEILTHAFQADATDAASIAAGLQDQKIDIVLTDVPYGQHSQWLLPGAGTAAADPIAALLEALRGFLAPAAIVAVAADKRQRIAHPAYRRCDHFQLGKRQVVVLKATTPC